MDCDCGTKSDWVAILDKMPPEKPRLRVEGTAACYSSGFSNVRLEPHEPQGINARILLLNLAWTGPKAGVVSDVVEPHAVRYKQLESPDYDEIIIVNCQSKRIKVEIVS